MAESLLCFRKKFSGKTLLQCGNHFYVSFRLRPKALCCRVVRPSVRPSLSPYINKYLFRIRSGVGGQGQFDFCLTGGQAGGGGGGQNKFEQKSRGSRQIIIFFSSLFRIFFFRVRGKVGQTNILFYFYYFNCFAKSIF